MPSPCFAVFWVSPPAVTMRGVTENRPFELVKMRSCVSILFASTERAEVPTGLPGSTQSWPWDLRFGARKSVWLA